MTEQEIRKEVKQRFRRMHWQSFLEGLKIFGCLAISLLFVAIISTPFIIHTMGVPFPAGAPKLNLSHDWMVATGILSIPFDLMMLAAFIMLFIVLPILSIKDAIKGRRESFETAVQQEMEWQKKNKKDN